MKPGWEMRDFMQADLNLAGIERIYFARQNNWSRSVPRPRLKDGLVFMRSGTIRYDIRGQGSVVATRDDVVKLPQDLVYSGVKLGEEPNSFFVADFSTTDAGTYANLPLPVVFRPSRPESIEKQFLRILELGEGRVVASKLQCKSGLYDLIAVLLADWVHQTGSAVERDCAARATDHIQAHFHESGLRIGALGRRFSVSESQLRRNFRKALHMSPLQYLQSQRIRHAKDMLLSEDASVQETALASGFSSAYYFSRSFKIATGLTPTEYRRSHGM
jgi:AraC-like DNA-binding protein